MEHLIEGLVRSALERFGLLPNAIVADEQIHRCPTVQKPKKKNGWFVGYVVGEGVVFLYGDWANEIEGTQKIVCYPDGVSEKSYAAQIDIALEEARVVMAVADAQRQAEARSVALKQINYPKCTRQNPYLKSKGVAPAGNLRAHGKDLIVPLYDADGTLQTCQRIYPDGAKRFLLGSKLAGLSFTIPGHEGLFYVVEGIATALSVHAASGATVVYALSSAKLPSVVRDVCQKHPNASIVVAGDDDHENDANVGRAKALEAATLSGAGVVFPKFQQPKGKSDFNDLHQAEGLEVVKAQLQKIEYPKPELGEQVMAIDINDFLLMDIPERELVLSPCFPIPGLAMLYAYRGVGKTYVGLTIALCVALGEELFSRWKAPRRRKVLYVDGEMPACEMQGRLKAILDGLGWEKPEPGYFKMLSYDMLEMRPASLASPVGQSILDSAVKDFDMVIFDNISSLCAAGDENSAESWETMQRWLLELRFRKKSVLLVHHAGKGGQL